MTSTPESMRDHWWWRPRVRPGRRLLVWHILSGKSPTFMTSCVISIKSVSIVLRTCVARVIVEGAVRRP